jgi:hypothetical protein
VEVTAAIPTNEPDYIVAGDSPQWTRTFPDYPSTTWTLSYVLINATNKYTFNATSSGNDYLVTLSGTTTAAWATGNYQWQAYVTSGSSRYTVASGLLEVKPNFATSSNVDIRTHAKKVLDAIEAVIEGRASKDQQEYTIGNRSLKLMPIADLIKFRDKYRSMYLSEVNADKVARGEFGKNRIMVRL